MTFFHGAGRFYLKTSQSHSEVNLTYRFGKINANTFAPFLILMHQSIPTVPIPPPPGNRGAFVQVVIPGGGAFAILSRPGGLALADPGRPPGIWQFIGKGKAFVKDWLVRHGLKKLVDVFKGMFS